MFPAALNKRLDDLIDELILNGGVEAASLASILMAAKDSVNCDYHVSLSRWVWAGVNDIKADSDRFPAAAPTRFETNSSFPL